MTEEAMMMWDGEEPYIQKILDPDRAAQIANYVKARNRRIPWHKTTLRNVCVRFRINQTTAKRVIDSVDFLEVSEFGYKPPREGADFGEAFFAGQVPQHWPDAPDRCRLIVVFD